MPYLVCIMYYLKQNMIQIPSLLLPNYTTGSSKRYSVTNIPYSIESNKGTTNDRIRVKGHPVVYTSNIVRSFSLCAIRLSRKGCIEHEH